jgi:hypothetical protein
MIVCNVGVVSVESGAGDCVTIHCIHVTAFSEREGEAEPFLARRTWA